MAKYFRVTITTQLLSTFKVVYSTNSNPSTFDHTANIWNETPPYSPAINLTYDQLTDNGGLIVIVDDDVYQIKIKDEKSYCNDCTSPNFGVHQLTYGLTGLRFDYTYEASHDSGNASLNSITGVGKENGFELNQTIHPITKNNYQQNSPNNVKIFDPSSGFDYYEDDSLWYSLSGSKYPENGNLDFGEITDNELAIGVTHINIMEELDHQFYQPENITYFEGILSYTASFPTGTNVTMSAAYYISNNNDNYFPPIGLNPYYQIDDKQVTESTTPGEWHFSGWGASGNFINNNSPFWAKPIIKPGLIEESNQPIIPTPPNLSFTTTWRTTSNNETITIGLDPSETYNFTVNWGDGSEETITSNSNLSHTYSTSGDYYVRIDGTFPRINMSAIGTTPNNLISINNWGIIQWTSMNSAFKNCVNLYNCNTEDTPDLSNVSNLSSMFENAGSNTSNLFINNINKWDTRNVNNISNMFKNATSFNQNINDWDVSNVITMNNIFNNATSFNQPLNKWELKFGVNIKSMFLNATSFDQNINDWDVSGINNLQQLFLGATSFNKPLNNWDTSEVTNMDAVFKNASSFNQPLNNWNVSNVTTTSQMFQNATSFNQPLNSWETNAYSTTSNIENMSFMFDNATSFIASLNSWDTSGVTNISFMFRNINDSSGNIEVSNWNVSNVTLAPYAFAHNFSSSPDLTSWNISNMTNIQAMLQGTSFNSDIKQWDLSKVTNAAQFMGISGGRSARFLPNSRYDDILNAFANETHNTTPTNLTIHFGNSRYTPAGASAKALLTNPVSSGGFGWTIIDGGQFN